MTDMPFILRIGHHSADLKKLHQSHGTVCSAFITAFNPDSEELTRVQNEERQGEDSFLVINIPEPEAVRLQEKYGQLAIVYCEEDAIPRLIF